MMLDFNRLVKCLAIGIAVSLGVQHFLRHRGITQRESVLVGIIGMIMAGCLDLGWPKTWFSEQVGGHDGGPPETLIPILPTEPKSELNLTLRTFFNECGARSKFYLNSLLDNHADSHVWQELCQEHIKELGTILPGGQELVKVLLNKLDAQSEVMASALSENPNRIKEALKNLHLNGKEVGTVLYQITGNKLSADELQTSTKECNDLFTAMVFARLEQNWLRDAKSYVKYQQKLTQLADQLASAV